MGYPRRATLCISSQAGCALGCTFCATGQFGFERHLEAGEIVAQVAYAQAFLRQSGCRAHPIVDQRRVHGDGRATGQLRPGQGGDPADDRGDGHVGAIDHGVQSASFRDSRLTESRGRYPSRSASSRRRRTAEHAGPVNRRYPLADLESGRRVLREEAPPALDRVELMEASTTRRPGNEARCDRPSAPCPRQLIALNPTPLTEETASTRGHRRISPGAPAWGT